MPREFGQEGYYEEYWSKNYYEVLGIPPDATEEDIKTAFRKLSKEHHPDVGGDRTTFQYISEAYSTLKDAHKRIAYDIKNQIKKASPNQEFYKPNTREHHSTHYEHNTSESKPDSPFKDKQEVIERDGLTIIKDGSGLLAREYLADPRTKQKLGLFGYNRIFLRDGLIIAQAGTGLLKREYLLNRETGHAINILGYDRIEIRNGKIVGINKEAGIFSSEVEEISNV